MQAIAKKRQGRCLSKEYINSKTKLKWECAKGHIWEAEPTHIKSGSWCPYCAGKYRTIEDMQKIATSMGGKCLSKKYINNRTKLKWQCRKGHVWETTPMIVKNGAWCPYCSGNARLNIHEMQRIAKKRGGRCVSEKYINANTKLKWQCRKGHIWEAIPNSVRRGSWCPKCAAIKKKGGEPD